MKKTLFIINICAVLLFGIYLLTEIFIDYSKYVRVIILSVYFLYAVIRAVLNYKTVYKTEKTEDGSLVTFPDK